MQGNQHLLGAHSLEFLQVERLAQRRLTRLRRTVLVLQPQDIGALAIHGLKRVIACVARAPRLRALAGKEKQLSGIGKDSTRCRTRCRIRCRIRCRTCFYPDRYSGVV